MESYICNSIFPLIFQFEKSIAQKEKKKEEAGWIAREDCPVLC